MLSFALALFLDPVGSFCYATSVNCPCPGTVPTGCPWTAATDSGARMDCIPLDGWQHAFVSNDAVALYIYGLPVHTFVVVAQGTTGIPSGITFGDGVRCIGGSMTRLRITQADQWGTLMFPDYGGLSLSSQGGVPPSGGYRSYQAMFRAAQSFCTPSTFNASNAIGIDWQP